MVDEMTVSLGASSPFGSYVGGRSHASESRTIRYFFTPSRLAIVATHFGLVASRDYAMEIDYSSRVDTRANGRVY